MGLSLVGFTMTNYVRGRNLKYHENFSLSLVALKSIGDQDILQDVFYSKIG